MKPPTLSRESRIRLDAQGRFWHEDALVEHAGLRMAMRTWIARHPDDGRVILTNGMDWCYILVDDLPLRIDHIAYDSGKSRWACSLFDGTVMTGTAEQFRVRADGSLLFCIGTESSERAGMMAKLSLEAVVELSAYLEEDDGNILLQDPEIGRKTKLQRLA